ncbi:MAG: Ig-like domain-containing protein [bacterium]|nr:Ig-like domain-containing protein [bacterium]
MKKYLMSLAVLLLCLLAVPTTTANAAAKINKTKATVYVGKTTKLKVNGTNKKVTWKTNQAKIATVKNGVVTGKKKGTATITAKVSGKSYKCVVTVKNASLSAKELKLGTGDTKKLTLNGAYKKVTYTSSNPKVATVKDGKVKGIKAGTAKITVKHNGKKYTCKVTVIKEKTIQVKLDKELFADSEMKSELKDQYKLKIKSTKVSGKYVIYTVTEKSYNSMMKKIKSEVDQDLKAFAKSASAITKATTNSKCTALNLYVKDGNVDAEIDDADVISLVSATVNMMMYQYLSGTLLEEEKFVYNYYDAGTNKLIISLDLDEM